MSGQQNFTTRYSQINSIQRDVIELKHQISQLSNKFAKYNKQMTDLIENNVSSALAKTKNTRNPTDTQHDTSRISENITFKKKGLTEIKGDIIMSGNIISENINNLSANVDVMLGQMLEAQRQLTEANTITVTRLMNINDVEIVTSVNDTDSKHVVTNLIIMFKRMPVGLEDSITFSVQGLSQPLTIYFDFIHRSTHTNHPNYRSFIVKNETVNTNENVYKLHVELLGTPTVKLLDLNAHTTYEFDQDRLVSYIVNYLDDRDKTFFETMLVNINEIKN